MVDDVILNKAATIERCVARVHEEYRNKQEFLHSYTRQDAAILNIQRACEASLALGQYIVRKNRLGLAQSARDIFCILAKNSWIEADLAQNMQRMIGFRNIAVHEYHNLQMPIVISIIERHLDDFLQYSKAILQHIL